MLDTSTSTPNYTDGVDFRFAESVLKAVKGQSGIVRPSYVYLPGVPGGDAVQKSVDGLDYFSTNVELGVPPPFQICANAGLGGGSCKSVSAWRSYSIREEFAQGSYSGTQGKY